MNKNLLKYLIYSVVFFRKNGKLQKRGKINLIGRLQLSTERSKEEDNQCIVQLRILRVQVTIYIYKIFFIGIVNNSLIN